MGLRDGRILDEGETPLYLISDIAFAAYLITRGYDLWGSVDTGKTGYNGKPRLDYALTHTDPDVLINMSMDVIRKSDEFEHLQLEIPNNKGTVNIKAYYKNIKQCHHALDNPIKRAL